MKVVFFGSGDFVSPVIETLKKNFDLAQIVTTQNELSESGVLGIIASYGRIVTKNVINSFPYGIINIHPSLLPKYRGPTPVPTAILEGEEKTGVSIIKIDEEVDHGPILIQKEEKISPEDTSETLLNRLFKIGAELLPNVIERYIKGGIELVEQDHNLATFTKALKKEDGFIDLENPPPPDLLDRMIRAFYPWPGVWFKTKLGEQNRIVKLLPGQKIQVSGKKPMQYKDFINGYKQQFESSLEKFVFKLRL